MNVLGDRVKAGQITGMNIRLNDKTGNRITDTTTIVEADLNGYVHLTVAEARQLLRNRRK